MTLGPDTERPLPLDRRRRAATPTRRDTEPPTAPETDTAVPARERRQPPGERSTAEPADCRRGHAPDTSARARARTASHAAPEAGLCAVAFGRPPVYPGDPMAARKSTTESRSPTCGPGGQRARRRTRGGGGARPRTPASIACFVRSASPISSASPSIARTSRSTCRPPSSAASRSITSCSAGPRASARRRSPISSRARWASALHVTSGPAIEHKGALTGQLTRLEQRRRAVHRRDPSPERAGRRGAVPRDRGFSGRRDDRARARSPRASRSTCGPSRWSAPRRARGCSPSRSTSASASPCGWISIPSTICRRSSLRSASLDGGRLRAPEGARELAVALARHAAHRQPPAAPGARFRRGRGHRRHRRRDRPAHLRAPRAWTRAGSTRWIGACSAS